MTEDWLSKRIVKILKPFYLFHQVYLFYPEIVLIKFSVYLFLSSGQNRVIENRNEHSPYLPRPHHKALKLEFLHRELRSPSNIFRLVWCRLWRLEGFPYSGVAQRQQRFWKYFKWREGGRRREVGGLTSECWTLSYHTPSVLVFGSDEGRTPGLASGGHGWRTGEPPASRTNLQRWHSQSWISTY